MSLLDLSSAISLTIQDDGMGMDNETKAHVFDKFFQVDKSNTQPGYSLGLTMVKPIVEL